MHGREVTGPTAVPPLPYKGEVRSTARRDQKASAASDPKTRKRAVVELEDATELSKAEEWQRAQAWATWEKIKAGDVEEVTIAQLREDARSVMAGPPPRSVRRL